MPPGTFTLTANPSGGVAPYTYLWSVRSTTNQVSGGLDTSGGAGTANTFPPIIASGGSSQVVHITIPAVNQIICGMLMCQVTDAVGQVRTAYFELWFPYNAP